MRAQWEKMGATDGSSTYATLRDGFESVGGTNMQSSHYWASKEDGPATRLSTTSTLAIGPATLKSTTALPVRALLFNLFIHLPIYLLSDCY